MNINNNKKIAVCYSGQMRNTRMVLETHINNLLIPLIEQNYTLDLYLYSDKYDTTRQTIKHTNSRLNTHIWDITDTNTEIFDYFQCKLKPYFNKTIIQINDKLNYEKNNYTQNMIGQLEKFYNVLNMVTGDYDIIIRLRPDIVFENKLSIDLLESNIIYQNNENKYPYNGDSIQIFHSQYLKNILENTLNTINNLQQNQTNIGYEKILNNIFIKSNLELVWFPNLAYRWYYLYADYFENIKLKYFEDWINREYKFTFNIDIIIKLINIRKQTKNILEYNNNTFGKHNVVLDSKHKLLYIAALNPDIFIDKTNENNDCIDNVIFKDVIGLIPCSGTASRIGGIPKFLLPCREGNLINNTINIFKNNNIDDIYISVSKENEH